MSVSTDPRAVSGAEPPLAPHLSGSPTAAPFRARHVEDLLLGLALLLMFVLPLAEIVLRRLAGIGIPGSIPIVQHLMLWVGFLGAAIAAREGTLLALATGAFLPEGRVRRFAAIFSAAVAAAIAALLCRGAVDLVVGERETGTMVAGSIRAWTAQLVLPISFALIAVRLVARSSATWRGRSAAASGLAIGLVLALWPELVRGRPAWPGVAILLAAAGLGAPIFALLGGAAVLLFLSEGVGPSAILIETYQLAVSPTLPSIPLFTLAGFLLAEGGAPERLLRVFRAMFGWMPGGTAVVCGLLSTFFTIFTGGSGVTILALGGLLLPALLRDGYRERFSLGLLTATGSLGLLLPPALPLILYAIVAQITIENIFIGGILPGMVLIGLTAAWGILESARSHVPRRRFRLREAGAALWEGKWEVMLPVVILVAFLGGYATVVETAALAALYAFVSQVVIHRDISLRRDFRRVFAECGATVGGVLVILGVAVGFTNYLIDADVPGRLLAWTQAYIHSPYIFLLGLNAFLLIVGCLMDIFSATFVVVPLIVPLGQAFGIHPVHLGIIFIANLELGYLTPPVGLNLFLASYRFKRPLMEVTAAALPMLAILGFGVLIITYVPWLTTGLLGIFGKLR
ncbi:MAG: TRAP transporter large permease subunit [Acidobacteria bacterium]|nr:TRAP transporter large permease subunit [Acidobacteriota bacterium]